MLFDCLAIAVMLLIACAAPRYGEAGFKRCGRALKGLARRKRLAVLVVGLMAFACCVAFALLAGMPIPFVHDEFAYLLGGDTFAQGRLTNPTHPMWEHFESFHIFFQPTYQSKYPPGQSLVLAVGQCLGHPIVGVWISLSLASAAVCWMLQGWVPPRWALWGGFLSILNIGMLRFWGNTYWGGAVAMLGGALMFGALPRLQRNARAGDALLMGIGLAILANSRPYEGLVSSLPVAAALLIWMCGNRRPAASRVFLSVIAPTVVMLAAAGTWMGYYNARVTGSPLKLPYSNWNGIYHSESLASTITESRPWSKSRGRKLPIPEESYETIEPSKSALEKLFGLWFFFLRPTLTIPFVAGLFLFRDRKIRFASAAFGLVVLAVLFQNTAGHPHYAAPVTALVYLVTVQGLRALQMSGIPSQAFGPAIVRWTAVIVVASLLLSLLQWVGPPRVPAFARYRQRIQQRLSADPQRHLIVVRYRSNHSIYHEWVYNDADIDAAKIVWARELSPEKNVRLMEYFHDRQVWLLNADLHPPELIPHRRDNSEQED